MKKLTTRQVITEINTRNKAFQNISRAEKRILVAKDVIAQIKAGRFEVATGGFVYMELPDSIKNTDSIQNLFITGEIPNCKCCGMGAVMMSCTLFKNKETVKDIEQDFEDLGISVFDTDNHRFKNGLLGIFSRPQLRAIELAFELGYGYCGENNNFDTKCIEFGDKYENEKTRLIAIMENIIMNGGYFKP